MSVAPERSKTPTAIHTDLGAYVDDPLLASVLAVIDRIACVHMFMDKLARAQLLILDDFATHSLTDQQRFHLLEIVEERYQRRSTLIIAQVPISAWHDLIGDATVPLTPFSIASSIMPTASASRETACASKKQHPS